MSNSKRKGVYRVPVNKVTRAELHRIKAKHRGKLKPEHIVDASKSKSNVLHPYFLWDNPTEAARLGRLEIARRFVSEIVVVRERVVHSKPVKVRVREWPGSRTGGYWHIDDVIDDKGKRAALLKQALEQIRSLVERHSTLRELAPVLREVEKIELRVSKRR